MQEEDLGSLCAIRTHMHSLTESLTGVTFLFGGTTVGEN